MTDFRCNEARVLLKLLSGHNVAAMDTQRVTAILADILPVNASDEDVEVRDW